MLPEYYNVLTNTDAVDILFDANRLYAQEAYTICVYQAFVAKQVFGKYKNKIGLLACKDLIDNAIRRLRSKIIKRVRPLTPFNIEEEIRGSEEVKELGECFRGDMEHGRLEEVITIYTKLVEGDSFDPFKKGLFSNN